MKKFTLVSTLIFSSPRTEGFSEFIVQIIPDSWQLNHFLISKEQEATRIIHLAPLVCKQEEVFQKFL